MTGRLWSWQTARRSREYLHQQFRVHGIDAHRGGLPRHVAALHQGRYIAIAEALVDSKAANGFIASLQGGAQQAFLRNRFFTGDSAV